MAARPRRLFEGGTAIDAVLGREDFIRALLLHGLSIGLDAEPGAIDLLVDDGPGGEDCGEEDDEEDGDEFREGPDADGDEGADLSDPDAGADDGWHEGVDSGRTGRLRQGRSGDGPRLYTATLVHEDGSVMLQAFHASVCSDATEAVERLVGRYGSAAAAAEVSEGFDPSTTFAEALVSPALGHMLALVADEPDGPLAAGLDLNLEQRFAA